MGYTHYWNFGPFISEESYRAALTDCRRIIKQSPVPLGNWEGVRSPRLYDGFSLNGYGDGACETFGMGNEPDRETWLCKTYQRPYDVVVVACLCVLWDRLGDKGIHITSDGDPGEWESGRELAERVLGRKIQLPRGVLRMERMTPEYRDFYLKAHPEYAD